MIMTERKQENTKRSRTTQGSVYPAMASIVSERTHLTTGTTLLYCRSGIIPQEEVDALSSIQPTRTTGVIRTLEQQFHKWLIEHDDEDKSTFSVLSEFARNLASVRLDGDHFSLWFYNLADAIGINEKHRTARQRAAIISEILSTFTNNHTVYHTGSSIEGTFASGEEHDYDVIQCHEGYPVFAKIVEPILDRQSFLIIRESTTPAGYFKLQLLVYGMPCTSSYNSDLLDEKNFISDWCRIDKCGRIVLYEIIHMPDGPSFTYIKQNKPAVKTKNYYGTSLDNNIGCRCKQWPTFAKEWISRDRIFGWPTNSTVQQLSAVGFFVVKKGHPLSPEKDLEWRASFSLQERELMFSLTDVQLKCYTVLKMFNREIIKSNCITSYHWKTCLFYFIEQNSGIIWKKELLFVCIKLCIALMLKWVKREFCPNYFIPQENLFDGTRNKSKNILLHVESKLEELLQSGLDCLVNIKASKICDYYRSRESFEDFQMLLSQSKNVLKKELYLIWRSKHDIALDRFNKKILDRFYYYASGNVLPFIEDLWSMLARIHNADTITEHTIEETKNALSFLLPLIYTCLASNIAVIAIQSTNLNVRDFLLFGSFTYFMKGALCGRLKFISALYAIGLYEDCEWYLDQFDE